MQVESLGAGVAKATTIHLPRTNVDIYREKVKEIKRLLIISILINIFEGSSFLTNFKIHFVN